MGERLTQGDIDKIKKEIEYRTLVVRKEAIEAVSEARAQGDLSAVSYTHLTLPTTPYV